MNQIPVLIKVKEMRLSVGKGHLYPYVLCIIVQKSQDTKPLQYPPTDKEMTAQMDFYATLHIHNEIPFSPLKGANIVIYSINEASKHTVR